MWDVVKNSRGFFLVIKVITSSQLIALFHLSGLLQLSNVSKLFALNRKCSNWWPVENVFGLISFDFDIFVERYYSYGLWSMKVKDKTIRVLEYAGLVDEKENRVKILLTFI